jgi:isopenicillin-N N-acyltransferase-like protein
MKRRTFLKKSALATVGFAVSPLVSSNFNITSILQKGINKNKSENIDDLRIITLEGTPRHRGQTYGETLRSKILEIIKLWKNNLHQSLDMDPDKYLSQMLEETDFLPAIKKWTPDLLEEVRGIAEGAGVDFKTMYVYQLGDEDYWYGQDRRIEIALQRANKCSVLGVFDGGPRKTILAQNMDIESYTDGYEVLLHIKHQNSPLESLIYTIAGYISLTGMNNSPLAVCVNALLQLNYSTDGLPVAFVIRALLEKTNLNEAIKFLGTIKHASGQNYAIASPDSVVSYECSENKVSQFTPYEGATRVYHTNHPLVNDDQSKHKKMLKKFGFDKKKRPTSNSEVRFNFLKDKLKDTSQKVTVATVKSILGSHEIPICFHKQPEGGGMTAGCLIMELTKSPTLHLAPGPPCSTEFKIFTF